VRTRELTSVYVRVRIERKRHSAKIVPVQHPCPRPDKAACSATARLGHPPSLFCAPGASDVSARDDRARMEVGCISPCRQRRSIVRGDEFAPPCPSPRVPPQPPSLPGSFPLLNRKLHSGYSTRNMADKLRIGKRFVRASIAARDHGLTHCNTGMLLVRHAESEANLRMDVIGGQWHETPLSSKGATALASARQCPVRAHFDWRCTSLPRRRTGRTQAERLGKAWKTEGLSVQRAFCSVSRRYAPPWRATPTGCNCIDA
jgi:hypothetical protein